MDESPKYFSTRSEFINFITSFKQTALKNALLCDLCRDKNVLDLGCIDHSYQTALTLGDGWLHKQLKDNANTVIGIDILKDDIRELNQRGFDILEANVESFDLGKKFDVIVAGDIIEHLSNIGLFLNCVKNHMHSESICVITTPNPFNIEQMMKAIFDNQIYVNEEHTTWLDPVVMYETLTRNGFEIIGFHWINTRFRIRVSNKLFRFLTKILSYIVMKVRPICRRDFAIVARKK